MLITASEDQTLKMWNLQKTITTKKSTNLDVEPVYTFRGHTGGLIAITTITTITIPIVITITITITVTILPVSSSSPSPQARCSASACPVPVTSASPAGWMVV